MAATEGPRRSRGQYPLVRLVDSTHKDNCGRYSRQVGPPIGRPTPKLAENGGHQNWTSTPLLFQPQLRQSRVGGHFVSIPNGVSEFGLQSCTTHSRRSCCRVAWPFGTPDSTLCSSLLSPLLPRGGAGGRCCRARVATNSHCNIPTVWKRAGRLQSQVCYPLLPFSLALPFLQVLLRRPRSIWLLGHVQLLRVSQVDSFFASLLEDAVKLYKCSHAQARLHTLTLTTPMLSSVIVVHTFIDGYVHCETRPLNTFTSRSLRKVAMNLTYWKMRSTSTCRLSSPCDVAFSTHSLHGGFGPWPQTSPIGGRGQPPHLRSHSQARDPSWSSAVPLYECGVVRASERKRR